MSILTLRCCWILWLLAVVAGVPRAAAADPEHWAFRAPARPPVPHVAQTDWVHTPVDAFILAKLETNGVTPASPAPAGKWLRRAAFDLLGLPPTLVDVELFQRECLVDDGRARARWIDRLLASPHYGERWGRHWLDLARYADSNGFEFDFERPHAWHYRDWVIDSLNADKPYDQFMMEQIAGDEITPGNFQALVATGFCRNGPTVGNQSLEKHRWDELDDVISTTSEVFLGLTLGCARCHDHKYDPVSQRDYYAMLAIFNSSGRRETLIGTPQQRQRRSQLDKQIREVRAQISKLQNHPSAGDWQIHGGELIQRRLAADVRLLVGNPAWTDYTVDVEVLKTAGTEKAFNYEAGVSLLFRATAINRFYWLRLGISDNREHRLAINDRGGRAPISRTIPGRIERNRWYHIRIRLQGESLQAWLDDRLLFQVKDRRLQHGRIGFGNWLSTTRWRNLEVRDAQGALLLKGFPDLAQTASPKFTAATETVDDLNEQIRQLKAEIEKLPIARGIGDGSRQPRETRLFERGDHRRPAGIVEPGVPAILTATPLSFPAPPETAKTTGRRHHLAKWLATPQNPLTARVMVNRIWQYHFGRGLVETTSNFGLNGSPPSHPRLLDWLAMEFIESGWSIKHIHRLIMCSSVYGQTSSLGQTTTAGGQAPREQAGQKLDPFNRLLWKFPKRRLEAELIRDQILAASGSLNTTMHGPGVRPRIHPDVIATSTTRKWPTVIRETSEHWRRSIYVFSRRSVLLPMLESFDAPTTTQSCDRRLTTTVPTQALQLLNDVFTNHRAATMAQDLLASVGPAPARQIHAAYGRCLSRAPTHKELANCLAFLEQQRAFHSKTANRSVTAQARALTDLCHVMFNLNEFIYVD